ncbi:MAG: hypothetical protein IT385_15260 [Deltaproteobacteria bacterium]|nr:hypothetical protein [Deltaproteobacteria bacterium]
MPSLIITPMLLMLVATACGGERASADAPGLPPACQTLADGLWLCASRLPSGAREPLLETLERQKQGWLERARAGGEAPGVLERGCRDALDQVRGSTRELCAGIGWAPIPTAPTTSPAADAGSTSPDASGPSDGR